jgi:hypothetical protein
MSAGPKYELVEQESNGLWRIRALRDIPRHLVRKGDLGGLVSGPNNLSQYGDAWVGRNAQARDNSRVQDNALVTDFAELWDTASIVQEVIMADYAKGYGYASLYDWVRVVGEGQVSGNSELFDNITVEGQVSGNTHLGGSICIGENARVTSARHVLTLSPITSENRILEFWKTEDGHHIEIGCWFGDVDKLEKLAHSDDWPSGSGPKIRAIHRPELLAVVDLIRARIASWEVPHNAIA